jgi:hypothetical protein
VGPRVRRGVAVLLALALLLTGCVTEQGGRRGDMRRAALQAASALSGAALAVDLLGRARGGEPYADTSVANAITEAQDAQAALELMVVGAPEDDAARRRSLALVTEATVALVEAREWVAGTYPGEPPPTDRLRDLARQLSTLADELAQGP